MNWIRNRVNKLIDSRSFQEFLHGRGWLYTEVIDYRIVNRVCHQTGIRRFFPEDRRKCFGVTEDFWGTMSIGGFFGLDSATRVVWEARCGGIDEIDDKKPYNSPIELIYERYEPELIEKTIKLYEATGNIVAVGTIAEANSIASSGDVIIVDKEL